MEATVIIGALCTALGAVCGYFVRKESTQYAQVNERLEKLETSFSFLTNETTKLATSISTLTVIASANAKADEEQNKTMATILDRALNCQQCFRGPIHRESVSEELTA